MIKTPRAGRAFEELVARLETILAPTGAKITSPDRVSDQVTGSLREVDVSIKFTENETDRLITVECRDRVSDEDATWIEQLATKQRDIGAWKTYAVSSGRFTGPAIAKAKQYGIEIRQFSEITDAEIAQEWASSSSLKLDILRPDVYLVGVSVQSDADLPEEFHETLEHDLVNMNLEALFTPADIQKLYDWLVDPNESKDSFHFSVSSHYVTQVAGQTVEADFVAHYAAERRVVNISIQSIQQYKSPSEILFQVLQGSGNDESHSFKAHIRGRFNPFPSRMRPK